MSQVKQGVKEYYGQDLQGSEDLKTSACCPVGSMPDHVKPYIANVHDEIVAKFYGCGSPIPPVLKGKTVLDLGCGTGRDCYVLSQMVGEKGKVIGVDMTEEQLDVAKRHLDYQMKTFGFKKPNVEFLHGEIEALDGVGIADNSIDVIVSNCVVNLCIEKEKLFSEIFRVLKPGGELYFSDVFASRRVPTHLMHDKEVMGECLGGAMYLEDFRRLLFDVGCPDYRVVEAEPIVIDDAVIKEKVGMIDFSSVTVRAFKCDLEDRCEDYGHVAYYKGTIKEFPHAFVLDDHHVFKTGMPVLVCGNTANMILQSRYGRHFRVEGDFTTHYGLFDCVDPVVKAGAVDGACC